MSGRLMTVSIIILAHNRPEMTRQCIDSIIKNSDDYEIIIVDNGSSPSFQPENEMIDITHIGASSSISIKATPEGKVDKVLRNETNLGFPVAVNQGIRESNGDIICLLNNDTVVTPGWLKKLCKRLECGYEIVGPMTNYVAGLQRAMVTTYDDNETLNKSAAEWAKKNTGLTMGVNFVIGFCMVFKKSLVDRLGDFDESMWPCSGEEIDFCLKCRAAGGQVGIAQDVYIHHYGSQTFGDMQKAGQLNYQDVCKKCNDHLAERWGSEIWENQGVLLAKTDDTKDKLRLNLGCGRYQLSNFTNIDKSANVDPDLVCDALHLPYRPESVDEIYCGHMLEHLTHEEGIKALKHWRNLLKPGGKITVTVPDFDVFAEQYFKNPTLIKMKELNDIYIYSYCQESHHRYCYSGALLEQTMVMAGFKNLKRLPKNHPYFVSPVDWQVAYEGRKQ